MTLTNDQVIYLARNGNTTLRQLIELGGDKEQQDMFKEIRMNLMAPPATPNNTLAQPQAGKLFGWKMAPQLLLVWGLVAISVATMIGLIWSSFPTSPKSRPEIYAAAAADNDAARALFFRTLDKKLAALDYPAAETIRSPTQVAPQPGAMPLMGNPGVPCRMHTPSHGLLTVTVYPVDQADKLVKCDAWRKTIEQKLGLGSPTRTEVR